MNSFRGIYMQTKLSPTSTLAPEPTLVVRMMARCHSFLKQKKNSDPLAEGRCPSQALQHYSSMAGMRCGVEKCGMIPTLPMSKRAGIICSALVASSAFPVIFHFSYASVLIHMSSVGSSVSPLAHLDALITNLFRRRGECHGSAAGCCQFVVPHDSDSYAVMAGVAPKHIQ